MSAARIARCRCGQLTATARGEPMRVSVCHCLHCRRRTGAPFSSQGRFPISGVTIEGTFNVWTSDGEPGRRAFYRWCPSCGSTVAFTNEALPDTIAIWLGAFDGEMPVPHFSMFEDRKPGWIEIVGEGIVHD